MENAPGGDAELISKTLQVEHKIFYFDLKENPRGQYLKISEKTPGSRSTIILPASGISVFVELFKYYVAGNDSKDSSLESTEAQLGTKVFYFDVGENQRGRFLKVSEVTRNRSTIIIPAGNADKEGWAAFCDILIEIEEGQHLHASGNRSMSMQDSSLAEEHAGAQHAIMPGSNSQAIPATDTDDGSLHSTPSSHDTAGTFSKVLRVEQKRFFFDLGSNTRGQYLRISEVSGADRSAIILPTSALEQFYETIGHFLLTVKTQASIPKP